MSAAQGLQGALRRPGLRLSPPGLAGRRALVTGSSGTIGTELCAALERAGADVVRFDQAAGSDQDVLDREQLDRCARRFGPDRVDCIFHLAAHKHAMDGEDTPARVALVNVQGTANARAAAEALGADLVLASTCKAADPCTAYGASKLIAEREALRYERARALRLVNVLGSSGSVLQIWAQLPAAQPLPVVLRARRMWIDAEEAAGALMALLGLPRGLYAPAVPPPEPVHFLAERLHPTRAIDWIPPRRGDRLTERVVAEYETAELVPGQDLLSIAGPWG